MEPILEKLLVSDSKIIQEVSNNIIKVLTSTHVRYDTYREIFDLITFYVSLGY